MPNYAFNGKRALVMGGSKGLGYATAEALAKDGAAITLVSRSADSLNQAVQALDAAHGVTASALAVDVNDVDAFGAALDKAGEIDILVTNCGGPPPGLFADFSLEDWEEAYRAQIQSAVQACQAFVPDMAARGWGRVVMIASVTVGTAFPNLILSNALRPGLLGLARSLGREYAKKGVTFNLVCPGLTLTQRLENLIADNAQKQGKSEDDIIAGMTANIPAGRLGNSEEFGATAAFLASAGAAYINGQAIYVDGGYTS